MEAAYQTGNLSAVWTKASICVYPSDFQVRNLSKQVKFWHDQRVCRCCSRKLFRPPEVTVVPKFCKSSLVPGLVEMGLCRVELKCALGWPARKVEYQSRGIKNRGAQEYERLRSSFRTPRGCQSKGALQPMVRLVIEGQWDVDIDREACWADLMWRDWEKLLKQQPNVQVADQPSNLAGRS